MYDGDKAVLTMVQYLKEDKEKDENIYEATVIEYQKEMERLGYTNSYDPAIRQSF